MEAARTSETSANFYHTARRYKPEDGRLQDVVVWRGTDIIRSMVTGKIAMVAEFKISKWR
jgi:hypothetical protein